MRVAVKKKINDQVDLYKMSDPVSGIVHILDESFSERDLGVQMKSNLNWDDQCKIAAMKGNTALATIHKTFKSMDVKMLSSLYKTYVRPHLEYAVQAWCAYNSKDIKCLEMVQRRATK